MKKATLLAIAEAISPVRRVAQPAPSYWAWGWGL